MTLKKYVTFRETDDDMNVKGLNYIFLYRKLFKHGQRRKDYKRFFYDAE